MASMSTVQSQSSECPSLVFLGKIRVEAQRRVDAHIHISCSTADSGVVLEHSTGKQQRLNEPSVIFSADLSFISVMCVSTWSYFNTKHTFTPKTGSVSGRSNNIVCCGVDNQDVKFGICCN